jgi:cellobiose phosphorylase
MRGASASSKYPCLCAGQNISLDPGESERLVILFGYGKRDAALGLCEKYSKISDAYGDLLSFNADLWSPRLSVFSIPDIPEDEKWASREFTWHSCQTRGSLLYDEYYQNHYLPQGGAYEYIHGLRGAVRDLALFNQALMYLSPQRASELLEYCLRMVSSTGEIKYAAHGYGCCTGAVAHSSPSDLQLFLLWSITDYVFFTRDFEFLGKVVPFYPRNSGESSVLDRVKLSVDYILNKIGTGEHGLMRVGDGDWSDGISFFVKDRARFLKKGESSFNTAMAIYVLPRVADLLERHDPSRARKLREKVSSLKTAMLACYNGKWFFRGFDGAGAPIGDNEIFLEHHAWLLISDILSADMADSVVNNIFDILDAPAGFGQFVLYPPKNALFNTFARGWDVNGGVWFAINYLLAWGVGRRYPKKAWAVFRKNSMAMKATVDPGIWYGIWSGPDSYNADYAERPRETYFHIPTPTTDFPVMNLNLHAGYVAALIRLCGVEPMPSGTEPKPLLPFKFKIDTPTFELSSNNRGVRYQEKLPIVE